VPSDRAVREPVLLMSVQGDTTQEIRAGGLQKRQLCSCLTVQAAGEAPWPAVRTARGRAVVQRLACAERATEHAEMVSRARKQGVCAQGESLATQNVLRRAAKIRRRAAAVPEVCNQPERCA
jgi:hypothetical protein